jgi:hypothetical protein
MTFAYRYSCYLFMIRTTQKLISKINRSKVYLLKAVKAQYTL